MAKKKRKSKKSSEPEPKDLSINADTLQEAKEKLKETKKSKKVILQERKGFNPDEEWEDEEITVPVKKQPKPGQEPPVKYPDEEMEPPDPPPIKNEEEEEPQQVPPQNRDGIEFQIVNLFNDPDLYTDPTKLQKLVINLNVMNYLAYERQADSFMRVERHLADLKVIFSEISQAMILVLDEKVNLLGRMAQNYGQGGTLQQMQDQRQDGVQHLQE